MISSCSLPFSISPAAASLEVQFRVANNPTSSKELENAAISKPSK
jgi:hypothetical protein